MRCQGPALLMRLDIGAFQQLTQQHPTLRDSMLAVAAERAAFSTSREQRRRLTSGVVGGGGASPPSPPEAVVAAARAAAGRAPAMSAEDARVVVAQAEQLEVSKQSSRPPHRLVSASA